MCKLTERKSELQTGWKCRGIKLPVVANLFGNLQGRSYKYGALKGPVKQGDSTKARFKEDVKGA